MYKSIRRLIAESSLEINLMPYYYQAIHLKYTQPALIECFEAYRYTKNSHKFFENVMHSFSNVQSVYQLFYAVNQKHLESNVVSSYFILYYLKHLFHPKSSTLLTKAIEEMLQNYFKINISIEQIITYILKDIELLNDLPLSSLIKLLYIGINSVSICNSMNLQAWDILIQKLSEISQYENYQHTSDVVLVTRCLLLRALYLKNTPKYEEIQKLIYYFSKICYKFTLPIPQYNKMLVDITNYLSKRDIKYCLEKYLYTYYVDVYIEEFNSAIEINTFYHYYPYYGNSMNNELTTLKTKILKSVGINMKNMNSIALANSAILKQTYLDKYIDSIIHK